MADHRYFERPGDYDPLGVVPEPERASEADSEAFWGLFALLAYVALAITGTLTAQALTGAHPWTWWQVVSPLLCVPALILVSAIVRAYLPRGRHHG